MEPRLVGIDGPFKGRILAIAEDEVSIGREPSNQLCLSDPSVSRRHCLIRRHAGRLRIQDMNSRNGTFVNGLPVGERDLADGDEIRVGQCVLLLLLREEEEAPALRPRADVTLPKTRTVVCLPRSEAVYLKPEEVLESRATPARMARNLRTLLKVTTAIHASRGLEPLARQLLELVLDAIPARRGAILLCEKDQEEPACVFGLDRTQGPLDEVPTLAAMAARALREEVAILCNHLEDAELHAVLAVPLPGLQKTLGVLYLDSADPRVRFDEEYLQVATAIGCIAGMALESALRLEELETENRRLREEINIEHGMVGESPAMREVYQFIAKVAPTDSTVLICGESGTGKELVARAIHGNSPRAGRPFVAINCAALTETLLESELFGHEKGAFTGAIARKQGKLEVAEGGTVFLDEVGELPLSVQAKLLRAVQELEFERLGGTRPVKVNVRVIAATNRDLRQALASGAFRPDLYYRLNVVTLTMPPLRDRPTDILLLATYFTDKYARRTRKRLEGISAEARACLLRYDWPGNVRELENAIERAVVLGSADRILPEDLPEAVLETVSPAGLPAGSYHEAIREQKRERILEAIRQSGGSHAEAARLLGLHPTYLSRLIRNLGLKDAIRRSAGSRG